MTAFTPGLLGGERERVPLARLGEGWIEGQAENR